MGIPGLLKELNALVGRDAHISTYSGKRVAIDASGWLHRACYSCALDLLLSPSTTTAHLNLLRCFLALLASHSITPLLVFDGAQLPAKANTAAQRDVNRTHHRTLALHHLHTSPPNPELALDHAQKAISVTGDVTARFITLARELSVDLVVAPYEADAQMAWLVQHSLVDACITEDSDLMAFGCDRIFIRLDRNGHGRELVVSDLITLNPSQPQPAAAAAALAASTAVFLRRLRSVYLRGDLLGMCVLSGCDYLPSLRGVGLRTATKWWDDYKCIEVILLQMKRAKDKAVKAKRKGAGAGGGSSGKKAAVGGVKRKRESVDASERKEDDNSDVVVVEEDELLPLLPQRQPSQQSDSSQELLDGGGSSVPGDSGTGAVEGEEDEESVGNQGKEELYDGYALDYHKAILTFRHQLVYDTLQHRYAHLTPLPPTLRHLSSVAEAVADADGDDDVQAIAGPGSSIADSSQSLSSRMSLSTRHDGLLTSLDFLGSPPPLHLMRGLANGTIDPRTLRPYEERKLTDFFSTASERKELTAADEAAVAADRTVANSAARAERGNTLVDVDRDFFADLLVDADVDIPSAAAVPPTLNPSSSAQQVNSRSGSSAGGMSGSSGVKRPMSRAAVDKERRLKEERRSTGGGLLRFFNKTATVTAVPFASAAPT